MRDAHILSSRRRLRVILSQSRDSLRPIKTDEGNLKYLIMQRPSRCVFCSGVEKFELHYVRLGLHVSLKCYYLAHKEKFNSDILIGE